jgi:hypothetical protein
MNTSVILYILLASIGFGTVIVPMANAASFVCQPEWSLFRGNCYKVKHKTEYIKKTNS